MTSLRLLKIASLLTAIALSVGLAGAATITLDATPTDFYQQTSASPCVIGGENCQNGVPVQPVNATLGLSRSTEMS